MITKYSFQNGSRFPRKKAQAVGEWLEKLDKKQHGRVNAEVVVSAARIGSSPAHDFFEWDDKSAAHEYRLEQARNLMRSITIIYTEDSGKESTPSRAFLSVDLPENGSEEGTYYVPTFRVLSDVELRQQVLDRALAEMRSWAERYRNLKEIAVVIQAIEQVEVVTMS